MILLQTSVDCEINRSGILNLSIVIFLGRNMQSLQLKAEVDIP